MTEGRAANPPFSGEAAVWLLAAALIAGAGAVFAFVLRDVAPWPAPFQLTWWMLAPLYIVAEVLVVHVQLRREMYSISINEIPLVLGLFFAAPADLFIAHLVGSAIALGLVRRLLPIRVVFNVAHFLVETSAAILVFRAVATPSEPMGPWAWGAAIVAAFVVDVFAGVAVHTALSLVEGRRGPLPRLVGLGSLASVSNTSIALLLAGLLWFRPSLGLLLIVPSALVVLGYRSYHGQRRNHEGLQRLNESTRALQSQFGADAIAAAVVQQTRHVLGGDFSELLLRDRYGEEVVRTTLGSDGAVISERSSYDPLDPLCGRVAAEGQAVILNTPVAGTRMRGYFERHGITRAMAAPLFRKDEIGGVLVVGTANGDLGEFGADDLRLFQMLAQHAAVSLEKGALVDDLQRHAEENEYQARHDALTGFYNRVAFVHKVDDALASAPQDVLAAVMLLDLDRFKEVNDSLGHETGDEILIEVAARLAASLGEDAFAARLGGDEYGVFIPDAHSMAKVTERAGAILGDLCRPFQIEDLSLEVGGSIGIALFPQHGDIAQTLLQRADVAMYAAKEQHRSVGVYSPANDGFSPGRLKLVGELRAAIENNALDVYYQPKLDLATGAVVGVEALVRWDHGSNGFLPPDEFVAVAEHSGLIGPLTSYVLDRSLRQIHPWLGRGLGDFHLSVNVSVRSLLDTSLPAEVARMLEHHKVPPRGLRLEITESHIMADPARSISVLARLHEMGVGLAIDDFGTGYSSLAYLKRLPVEEIKIDRSFVQGMSGDDSDAVIVRAVIDLASNLGMTVVAEGIESCEVFNRLIGMGCQIGQGYYISRPLPAERLVAWLSERAPSDVAAGAAGPVLEFPTDRLAH